MRKAAATIALSLSLLVLAAPAGAQAVPTRAVLQACRTGDAPLDRSAVFVAQMGTVPGASRLQLRFDLLERLPGGGFEPVDAPGLGDWRSSTADIFRYRKQVAGLQAPGAYRAVVRFRWLDATGTPIRSTRRTTGICRQPAAGADLAVGAIEEQRTSSPHRARYVVAVRNDGRSDAGTFDVSFSLGSAQQPLETVESLAAGTTRTVAFVAPACAAGELLTVQLDPDQRIDQQDRTDDRRVVPCPSNAR